MSDDFLSRVVVTSSRTRVNTDQLYLDIHHIRDIGQRISALLAQIAVLETNLETGANSAPLTTPHATHTIQGLHAILTRISARIEHYEQALAYALLIHVSAEEDAMKFSAIWSELSPNLRSFAWAGGGIAEAEQGSAAGCSVHSGSDFERIPLPIGAGSRAPNGFSCTPSFSDAMRHLWKQNFPQVTIGSHLMMHAEEFVSGQGDGTLGLRAQLDTAAASRIWIGASRENLNPHDNQPTRQLSALAAAFSMGSGWLMNGRKTGVRVSTRDNRHEAASSPFFGNPSMRVDTVATDRTALLPDLSGTRSSRGGFFALAGAGGAVATHLAPTANPLNTPLPPIPAGRAPKLTTTPTSASQALERIASLNSSDDNGQIEILQHRTPGADGRVHTSWSVVIRGTQKWGLGEDNPQDMLSNLQGIAGEESDQTRAVQQAMEMAGIPAGEPVELIGHSQGGIVASQLAANPQIRERWAISSVLTAGSPTAGASVPRDIPMLNVENTRDIVPSLDGLTNRDRGEALTLHFDSGYLEHPAASGPAHAHALETYTEALKECEEYDPSRALALRDFDRWSHKRIENLGFNDNTRTTSYIFDTRRVARS